MCVFVWIFVCVCSDEFLGFKDLMVLCVCVYSDGFLCLFRCVCVCVCVWGSVCVVMGLNRLIGVSWVCMWLYVLNRCQSLREKERKKKKDCWKA